MKTAPRSRSASSRLDALGKAAVRMPTQAPAIEQRASRARRVGTSITGWLACVIAACGYVWLLSKIGPEAKIVAITFPSAVTAALLREHRFSFVAWRRWLVLWMLPWVVMEEYRLPVFVLAMTWAFHQFWIVERTTSWADVLGLAKQATSGTGAGTKAESPSTNASNATGKGHKLSEPTTTEVTKKSSATRRATTTSKAGNR